MRLTVVVITFVYLTLAQAVTAQTHPLCQSASSDYDGDGWGWEANRSCIVDEAAATDRVCVDSDGDGYGWDGSKTCLVITASPATDSADTNATSACIDTDGNGFGWDGTATCLVLSSNTDNTTSCVDSDGDGFGWDGSATCTVPLAAIENSAAETATCIDTDGDGYGWDGTSTCFVSSSPAPVVTTQSGSAESRECVDPDGDGFGWDGSATCSVPSIVTAVVPTATAGACVDSDGDGFGWNGIASCTTGLIGGVTDVVLMMGQSNALGENTAVDRYGLDVVNGGIIAWTQTDGWQVADLCTQIWQKGWFPWRGGVCSNHPAFQIAKGIIAADPSRKVAIIPTGMAGKPISWWDNGALAYELANEHTRNALADLPGHNAVDLVAWSQGEANHGAEDAWYDKLTDLISRLRSESWFDAQATVFIAQETKNSSVNNALPRFDNDGDDRTHWIQASDLPTKDGVHWSAPALRTLGNRYAAKYLSVD